MGDFISFKKMITPVIIQIVFWLGVAANVIAGIGVIVAGSRVDEGGGGLVFMGLLWIVFGPVLVRVYCELLILGFSINDTLTEIKNHLKNMAIR